MSIEWQMPEQVPVDESDPRIQSALAELQRMIVERYPDATFDVMQRDDPEGIRLVATVDIPDLDEVTNIILARMVEMQVEEGLPVYVVPNWPPERLADYLRHHRLPPIEDRASLAIT